MSKKFSALIDDGSGAESGVFVISRDKASLREFRPVPVCATSSETNLLVHSKMFSVKRVAAGLTNEGFLMGFSQPDKAAKQLVIIAGSVKTSHMDVTCALNALTDNDLDLIEDWESHVDVCACDMTIGWPSVTTEKFIRRRGEPVLFTEPLTFKPEVGTSTREVVLRKAEPVAPALIHVYSSADGCGKLDDAHIWLHHAEFSCIRRIKHVCGYRKDARLSVHLVDPTIEMDTVFSVHPGVWNEVTNAIRMLAWIIQRRPFSQMPNTDGIGKLLHFAINMDDFAESCMNTALMVEVIRIFSCPDVDECQAPSSIVGVRSWSDTVLGSSSKNLYHALTVQIVLRAACFQYRTADFTTRCALSLVACGFKPACGVDFDYGSIPKPATTSMIVTRDEDTANFSFADKNIRSMFSWVNISYHEGSVRFKPKVSRDEAEAEAVVKVTKPPAKPEVKVVKKKLSVKKDFPTLPTTGVSERLIANAVRNVLLSMGNPGVDVDTRLPSFEHVRGVRQRATKKDKHGNLEKKKVAQKGNQKKQPMQRPQQQQRPQKKKENPKEKVKKEKVEKVEIEIVDDAPEADSSIKRYLDEHEKKQLEIVQGIFSDWAAVSDAEGYMPNMLDVDEDDDIDDK
jgi:hypothetical protein